jgi:hypothetical protein
VGAVEMSLWKQVWAELYRSTRSPLAERHAKQVADLQEELDATRLRLFGLMNSDPYKAGFGDGVKVAIQQLHQWLTDCREHTSQRIEAMNPSMGETASFQKGYALAGAWFDEAIEQLWHELEVRANEVAAGHQEDARGEGS